MGVTNGKESIGDLPRLACPFLSRPLSRERTSEIVGSPRMICSSSTLISDSATFQNVASAKKKQTNIFERCSGQRERARARAEAPVTPPITPPINAPSHPPPVTPKSPPTPPPTPPPMTPHSPPIHPNPPPIHPQYQAAQRVPENGQIDQ